MEIRPRATPAPVQPLGRGSGAAARKRRSDALGPRKDIIIRLPDTVAHQLKVVAAHEKMTVQEFCEHAILPEIRKAMAKHGLTAEQLAR
jgi:hypothetical protein